MSSDDLIGVSEVAKMLGVATNTAWRWSMRGDFPPPAVRLAAGRAWRRADVETWAKAHLPLRTGRPPRDPAVEATP